MQLNMSNRFLYILIISNMATAKYRMAQMFDGAKF